MSLSGSGLEVLLAPAQWPDVPVLILGPAGSGRRTWADQIMAGHGAAWVWRSEAALRDLEPVARHEAERRMREKGLHQPPLSKPDAVRVAREFFRVKGRVTRWVSAGLDGASFEAQNSLLKVLEEMPKGERMILRGRPGEVLSTIRSRCLNLWLRPGTREEEALVLVAQGLGADEAKTLAELRPGRPGEALRMAEALPHRSRANSILSAAWARDTPAIALSLSQFHPAVRTWVVEWLGGAAAGAPKGNAELAKEAGKQLLMNARSAAIGVRNPRLAVRAAAMMLANRPNG